MQISTQDVPGTSNRQPALVKKRDGQTVQPFDFRKIENAMRKAWLDAEGTVDESQLTQLTWKIANTLPENTADVEQIQDHVEVMLMRSGKVHVAKAYILFREKRAEARRARRKPDPLAVSSYIHVSKYARHIPDLLRRELYPETVDRVEAMHLRKFAALEKLLPRIKWAFDRVREKRVLPSMRSMQFGGVAVEANNNRIFNCSFSFIDRIKAFSEAMYLLLCGCGVGYSVQFEHVEKLPALKRIDMDNVIHHVVEDTIEGWADALYSLMCAYVDGYNVEFSFHKVRAKGTPLKTSGGRAPGHRRLKESLENIRQVLHGAQGRQLRPIECHDILCFAADAVLSGGIRRSAMISLFSLEDSEMMYCKTGDWFPKYPWRQNANNSVVLKRSDVREKQFKRIFQMTKQWGEPGFFFVDDPDYGTNPCAEIGLNPKLVVNAETRPLLQKKLGTAIVEGFVDGDQYTGWAFCNLCEINGAMLKTADDFRTAAEAAAIIGTLQASYTNMPYLGWVSEVIADREALLGIGITGMMDSPTISCDPALQKEIANSIKTWNAEVASMIGIRPAARTTCVKPSGTTSLELGCVGSGHHAHHSKRYIRRVTADDQEVVFQAFKAVNPHMCVQKPDGKWVVEFPVEAPEGAILKENIGALEFLEMVKSTQVNWVLEGTARPESSPGLNHNVSNTVHVRPEEWDAVANYLWENRQFFTGVSFLALDGDKKYPFAPFEAITSETDEARWNHLIANYKPVDYLGVIEAEDGTALVGEAACAGGACQF